MLIPLNFNIPTHWNELNEWQLGKIGELFFYAKNKEQFKLKLISVVFRPKPSIINNIKLGVLIAQISIGELETYVDFLVKESNRTIFPDNIVIGSTRFEKPEIGLKNFTIDRFSFADMLYFLWTQEKTDTALDRLITILYLPEGIPFSREEKSLKHSSLLKKLPRTKKIEILLAFMGSREALIKKYPQVFQKNEKKRARKKKYVSYDEIILHISRKEHNPFGGLDSVKKASLQDFFKNWTEDIKDARRNTNAP